jgi:hypothetical protein
LFQAGLNAIGRAISENKVPHVSNLLQKEEFKLVQSLNKLAKEYKAATSANRRKEVLERAANRLNVDILHSGKIGDTKTPAPEFELTSTGLRLKVRSPLKETPRTVTSTEFKGGKLIHHQTTYSTPQIPISTTGNKEISGAPFLSRSVAQGRDPNARRALFGQSGRTEKFFSGPLGASELALHQQLLDAGLDPQNEERPNTLNVNSQTGFQGENFFHRNRPLNRKGRNQLTSATIIKAQGIGRDTMGEERGPTEHVAQNPRHAISFNDDPRSTVRAKILQILYRLQGIVKGGEYLGDALHQNEAIADIDRLNAMLAEIERRGQEKEELDRDFMEKLDVVEENLARREAARVIKSFVRTGIAKRTLLEAKKKAPAEEAAAQQLESVPSEEKTTSLGDSEPETSLTKTQRKRMKRKKQRTAKKRKEEEEAEARAQQSELVPVQAVTETKQEEPREEDLLYFNEVDLQKELTKAVRHSSHMKDDEQLLATGKVLERREHVTLLAKALHQYKEAQVARLKKKSRQMQKKQKERIKARISKINEFSDENRLQKSMQGSITVGQKETLLGVMRQRNVDPDIIKIVDIINPSQENIDNPGN